MLSLFAPKIELKVIFRSILEKNRSLTGKINMAACNKRQFEKIK